MSEAPSAKLHPEAPIEADDLGELTDDAITGSFRILQRKRGHRYSIDDVLTAFEGVRVMPLATRCLDLGTGIGSVLLMLAYKLPNARFCAIEAQTGSHRLLTQNVERNGLSTRVTLVHGDLRDHVGQEPLAGPFDLITGTPPYVAPGQATPSSDAQRAYARQEYRGGVEAYLAAAAPVLAPLGRIVVCADARFPERVLSFANQVQLAVLAHTSVLPREGKEGPLFSVFTLGHAAENPGAKCQDSTWVARNADGTRSQAYLDLRAFFGLAPRQ